MAINLVVEDGTGKVDANTYITVEEARKYAEDRGVTLDADDDKVAANLILAVDYMESHTSYRGRVSNRLQALSFPRYGLMYRGQYLPNSVIPKKVKDAQAQLLLDIKESGALISASQQFALKRKKLEGLGEFEYAVGSNATYSAKASHTVYDSLMKEFTNASSTGGTVYR